MHTDFRDRVIALTSIGALSLAAIAAPVSIDPDALMLELASAYAAADDRKNSVSGRRVSASPPKPQPTLNLGPMLTQDPTLTRDLMPFLLPTPALKPTPRTESKTGGAHENLDR